MKLALYRCSLQVGITTGNLVCDTYTTTLNKANQKKPNSRSWLLWKRVLDTFTTDSSRLLALGAWTTKHRQSGRWESYKSTIDHNVYKYKRSNDDFGNHWEQYRR